jgi:hypothetical protein
MASQGTRVEGGDDDHPHVLLPFHGHLPKDGPVHPFYYRVGMVVGEMDIPHRHGEGFMSKDVGDIQ